MKTKVKAYIEQFHMIEAGDKILVGVSGGADSVCLLFLLEALRKEMSLSLAVVHVNHGLRESALRDEAFVKALCESWEIPCYVEQVWVKEVAKQYGMTVEEAGRKARFDAFAKWKEQLQADRIALAHHKDDQAETVLFHLCRGCGVDGLVGIRPVRGDVIHPLLCVTRQEIENFLTLKKQDFVTDETNLETMYSRNILRHQVLPVLEERVCKASGEHMADTAALCLEAADYLAIQREASYEQVVVEGENGLLLLESLKQLHPYLQKAVLHQALAQAAGSRKDLEQVHILDILTLFSRQVGKRLNLPYGLLARREYEGVRLMHNKEAVLRETTSRQPSQILLSPSIKGAISWQLADKRVLSMRVFPYDKTAGVSEKTYTKWFDYDRIDKCLELRSRKTGDYFYIDETRRQTLKAYMINEKIPQWKRDSILVIADGNHILWAIGYRISSFYKVTEQTKQILEITIRGGKDDG